MSSQSPLKRKGMFFVFVMLIVLNVSNLIETFKSLSEYFNFPILLTLACNLCFLVFCSICLSYNDRKNKLTAISLAGYAAISALETFISICTIIFSEDFLFNIGHLKYFFNLIFAVILLIYAVKELIPFPGAEILNSPIVQLVAVGCVWLIPILCTFLFSETRGVVAGNMIITLLNLILKSIAFTWFIKE